MQRWQFQEGVVMRWLLPLLLVVSAVALLPAGGPQKDTSPWVSCEQAQEFLVQKILFGSAPLPTCVPWDWLRYWYPRRSTSAPQISIYSSFRDAYIWSHIYTASSCPETAVVGVETGGERGGYYLNVGTATEELRKAHAFQKAGLVYEAFFHANNILMFHPKSEQAKQAKALFDALKRYLPPFQVAVPKALLADKALPPKQKIKLPYEVGKTLAWNHLPVKLDVLGLTEKDVADIAAYHKLRGKKPKEALRHLENLLKRNPQTLLRPRILAEIVITRNTYFPNEDEKTLSYLRRFLDCAYAITGSLEIFTKDDAELLDSLAHRERKERKRIDVIGWIAKGHPKAKEGQRTRHILIGGSDSRFVNNLYEAVGGLRSVLTAKDAERFGNWLLWCGWFSKAAAFYRIACAKGGTAYLRLKAVAAQVLADEWDEPKRLDAANFLADDLKFPWQRDTIRFLRAASRSALTTQPPERTPAQLNLLQKMLSSHIHPTAKERIKTAVALLKVPRLQVEASLLSGPYICFTVKAVGQKEIKWRIRPLLNFPKTTVSEILERFRQKSITEIMKETTLSDKEKQKRIEALKKRPFPADLDDVLRELVKGWEKAERGEAVVSGTIHDTDGFVDKKVGQKDVLKVKPGWYVLEVEADGLGGALPVCVTDWNAVIVENEDAPILVAANSDGIPLPHHRILSYYRKDYYYDAEYDGKTDKKGLYRGNLRDDENIWLVGEKLIGYVCVRRKRIKWSNTGEVENEGRTGAGQRRWRRRMFLDETKHEPDARLYFMTDRPVYRPGDVVKFKGIVRRRIKNLMASSPKRYEPIKNAKVVVRLLRGRDVLLEKTLHTDGTGAFDGQLRIPADTSRTDHTIKVTCLGAWQHYRIGVVDWRRRDYLVSIKLKDGKAEVFGGYLWKAPVQGAKLVVTVGDKKFVTDKPRIVVDTKNAETVTALLKYGNRVLASKVLFLKQIKAKKQKSADQKTASEKQKPHKERPTKKTPPLIDIKLAKERFIRGDVIEAEVNFKVKPKLAFAYLGDTGCYWVTPLKAGEKVKLHIPFSGALDPGTYLNVVARLPGNGGWTGSRVFIPVETHKLSVKVDMPQNLRPGQKTKMGIEARLPDGTHPKDVTFTVRAVDEAVYTIKEECLPDIYGFFYPRRKAAPHPRLGSATGNVKTGFFRRASLTSLDYFKNRFFPVTVGFVDIVGCSKLQSEGYIDAYGVGGGRAGAYGARWGSGRLVREGGSPGSESAVLAALNWLWRHYTHISAAYGYWDADNFCKKCGGLGHPDADILVTAAAISALANHGNSHLAGSFRKAVRGALNWLRSQQRSDGAFINTKHPILSFLGHAMATYALANLYGMTQDDALKTPLQQALTWLIKQRKDGSGWGFANGEPNIMATAYAMLPLHTASLNGMVRGWNAIRKDVTEFARGLFAGGRVAFAANSSPPPELGGNWYDWAAMAAAVLAFCDQTDSAEAAYSQAIVAAAINANETTPHLAFWAIRALSGIDDKLLANVLRKQLSKMMRKGGCTDGSFDPVGCLGALGGRVFSTAVGGIALEGCYMALKRLKTRTRKRFPETPLWLPSVTAKNGVTTIFFNAPDTISSFRVFVLAVTPDTDVGSVTTNFVVRQPFFAKLHLPPFFNCGDTIRIYADIYNYTDKPTNGVATLKARGAEILGNHRVGFHALSGASTRVFWTLKVSDVEKVTVKALFESSAGNDAVQMEHPVRPVGKDVVITGKKEDFGDGKFEIRIPSDARELRGRVRVVPKGSGRAAIMAALKYLIKYPYGCVEQTMDRFLPLVVAAEVVGEAGKGKAFIQQHKRMIEAGLKRLYNYQKTTGGWGWWSNDKEDPYMSAYVFWGLTRAKRAGIKVNSMVLRDALNALQRYINSEKDPNRLAFQLFAYAYATGKLHQRIWDLRSSGDVNPYGEALLVLALCYGGRRDLARLDAQQLANLARGDGVTASWSVKNWFYRWEGVEIEATAFCVWALLESGVGRETAEAAIRWLIKRHNNSFWGNTKDTAAVIFALAKYISVYGDTLPVEIKRGAEPQKKRGTASVTLLINDKKTDARTLNLNDPFSSISEFELPADVLRKELTKVEVVCDNDATRKRSRIEWSVGWTESKPAKPAGDDLKIRWVQSYDGMRVGETRVVSVEVEAKEDAAFAVVSIPVPSGCEIVGVVGAGIVRRERRYLGHSDKGEAKESVIAGFEGRYREALLFIKRIKTGKQTFSVRVRAVFAGRFWMQPARVFCMYAPQKQAHSATTKVEILP